MAKLEYSLPLRPLSFSFKSGKSVTDLEEYYKNWRWRVGAPVLLELANFQSLREPCEIPLTGLTLMYGPNGAGKSAVLDALKLASAFWSGDHEATTSLLTRWIHRNANGLQNPDDVTVRVTFYAPTALDDISGERSNLTPRYRLHGITELFNEDINETPERTSRPLFKLGVTWGVRQKEGTEIPRFDVSRMDISIDNEVVFEWKRMEGTFLHGIASLFVAGSWIKSAESLREPLKEFADQAQRRAHYDDFKLSNADGWLKVSMDEGLYFLDMDRFSYLESTGFHVFEAVLHFLRVTLGNALADACAFGHVGASRSVPSQADLVSLIPPNKRNGDESTGPSPIFGVVKDVFDGTRDRSGKDGWGFTYGGYADRPFDKLARGALSAEKMDFSKKESIKAKDQAALFTEVNRHLSDHLFVEQGYCVRADLLDLVPRDRTNVQENPEVSSSERDFGTFCLLGLKDHHGRELRIDDVGSGIGYLLPVLIEAADCPFSAIEQPELHLHPALQSALADVFLDLGSSGHLLLVETHSEHLMLRILRRARETAACLHESDGLKCNGDKVTVLYFDPQPDGSTRVKRLRLTPKGDFLDRWPRGFFSERDGDLLSE